MAVIWLASILLPWPVARPLVAIAYLLLIVAALPALLILWQAFQTPRAVQRPVADVIVTVRMVIALPGNVYGMRAGARLVSLPAKARE